MSRLALIYPKIAIFRNRNHLAAASSPLSFSLIKNQQDPNINSIPLNIMSRYSPHRLGTLMKNFSSQSAPSSLKGANTDTKSSEVIQRDLFELALKALSEFIESRNSSALTIERKAHVFSELYRTLQRAEKKLVLDHLAAVWTGQQEATLNSAKKYISAQDKGDAAVIKAEDNLRNALAVDQAWMLSALARQEGGIKFLIDIRADILDILDVDGVNVIALRSVANAIRDLIAPCFGIDLLHLDRVTWSSPGNTLQYISEGEAVHPIRSWSDLKKRLGPYRRCFTLTHPAVPHRPLAILHVALTKEISSNIHSIISRPVSLSIDIETETLEAEDSRVVNTAIFYSISSTQKGLAGIDLGQSLIKRAVRALQAEIPSLERFSTLSPIPGFRSWLLQQLRETERGRQTVLTNFNWRDAQSLIRTSAEKPLGQLRQFLVDSSWTKDASQAKLLEEPLMRLCAHYLYIEKRRNFALDSVANFHLRNGAMMWRLNWAADLSPRGLKNSFGMMMNYRYFLEACETNSRAYVEKQWIESSEQVRHLASDSTTVLGSSGLSRL